MMPAFRKELSDLRQGDIRRSSEAVIRRRSRAREPMVARLSSGLARWLHVIAIVWRRRLSSHASTIWFTRVDLPIRLAGDEEHHLTAVLDRA
jgi:hypothetical protein